MAIWETHGVQPRCCPFCGQGLNFDLDHCIGASHYEKGEDLYYCAIVKE